MNKQRGFTFIEVIIVVSIMCVVCAIAAQSIILRDRQRVAQQGQQYVQQTKQAPIRASSTEYALGNTDFRFVYTFHDESKRVSCWMFSGGGIFCIPDNQLTEHKD